MDDPRAGHVMQLELGGLLGRTTPSCCAEPSGLRGGHQAAGDGWRFGLVMLDLVTALAALAIGRYVLAPVVTAGRAVTEPQGTTAGEPSPPRQSSWKPSLGVEDDPEPLHLKGPDSRGPRLAKFVNEGEVRFGRTEHRGDRGRYLTSNVRRGRRFC